MGGRRASLLFRRCPRPLRQPTRTLRDDERNRQFGFVKCIAQVRKRQQEQSDFVKQGPAGLRSASWELENGTSACSH